MTENGDNWNWEQWQEHHREALQLALANDPKAVLATASHLARIQAIINEEYKFYE